MKRPIHLPHISVALATVMLLCGGYSAEASVADVPLSVTLAFETPPTVSLGEPIIGHYTITNTSSHDQICRVGSQTNGCLTPADSIVGRPVSLNQSPLLYTEAGEQEIRVPSKNDHGGVHTGYFVINGWHEPGQHLLSLTVHFSYSAAQDNASPGYGEHSDNNPVVNQVFETEVAVLPTNVRQVRENSEVLRRSVLKEKDVSRRHLFIMALFSMPETLVHDCWARLVSDARTTELDQTYITQQLSLVPSIETADIFAYQIWDTSASILAMPGTPKYELANLYDHGDAAVRQHIRDLYAQHGIQVADTIDLPTTGD